MQFNKFISRKLSKFLVHPSVLFLCLIYLPSIFLLLTLSNDQTILPSIFLLCLGFFIWTLVEYLVHRFIFHHQSANEKFQKFQFFIHGYHHAQPRDSERYVLPLFITVPVFAITYLLFRVIFAKSGEPLCAGFIVGYLAYDMTHYALHRFRPLTLLGKHLKYHHFYHHFKNNERCFGVTNTFWDYIFNTKT